MSTSRLGDKQQRHELARALAEGYRFDPTNKPPLRPGTHVRLRKGDEHTVVRLESEEEVTTLKNSNKSDAELLKDYWAAHAQFGPFEVGPDEFIRRCRSGNGETAQGTEEAASPDDGRSAEPGMGTETP